LDAGYETLENLPGHLDLSTIQERQLRAVQSRQLVTEAGLKSALLRQRHLAFLDFETVGLAIPVWDGCHPYDAVPVQFSCHVQDADGHVTHHEWLAEGPEDPRPALAERLVRACEGARTVVAYNAGFEGRCIEQMAEALPVL